MNQLSLFSFLQNTYPKRSKGRKSKQQHTNSFSEFFTHQDTPIILNRKAYQRSIQIYIKPGGKVYVTCAFNSPLKELTAILNKHWKWIQKQLSKQNLLRKKYPVKKFRVGETFLFQGRKLKLQYEKIHPNEKLFKTPEKQKGFYIEKDRLVYIWNHLEDLNKGFLKNQLRNFYEREGGKKLQKSLLFFSSRMQVFPQSIHIGSPKSLWGSCSSKGAVSLNWRLIAAPPFILNYVVIHELAHLKHLDHSPAFWSLVADFCPKYKCCEQWLKDKAYAMDFLLPHSELHG